MAGGGARQCWSEALRACATALPGGWSWKELSLPFSNVFQMKSCNVSQRGLIKSELFRLKQWRSWGKGSLKGAPLRPSWVSLCRLCLPGEKQKSHTKSRMTYLRLECESLKESETLSPYVYILQNIMNRISNDICEILFHKMLGGNNSLINVG